MAVLKKDELKRMDEYFRVLNYLSAAQLYLLDNPLLRCSRSLGNNSRTKLYLYALK